MRKKRTPPLETSLGEQELDRVPFGRRKLLGYLGGGLAALAASLFVPARKAQAYPYNTCDCCTGGGNCCTSAGCWVRTGYCSGNAGTANCWIVCYGYEKLKVCDYTQWKFGQPRPCMCAGNIGVC